MKQLTTNELNSVSGGFFKEAWDRIKEAFGGDGKNKSPTEKAKDACKVIGAVDKMTSLPGAGKVACDAGSNAVGKYIDRQKRAMGDK